MEGSVDFLLSLHVLIGLLSLSHSQVSSTTIPPTSPTASVRQGWSLQSNWQTFGGILQSGVNTLTDCQQRCENDPSGSCTGIDWSNNNPYQEYCWFSGSGGSQGASGIDHWIYTRASGITSLPSTNATSGTSTTSAATTTASNNQFCDNTTWIETVRFSYAHTIGQTIYAMNNSRCCLYLCEATPSCQGFDWYSNDSTCAHWNSSSANITNEADNSIHHFVAIKNLTYCNAYAIDLINWQAMADTHAFYGQPQTDISTLNDCLSRCQADTTCRGVDWDKDNQCWFHLDTYPDAVYGKGVTLFIKQYSRNLVSPSPTIAPLKFDCSVYLPTTTTAKTTTTMKGSPTNNSNPAGSPTNNSNPSAAASNFMDSSSLQPFAIKPAYIVLAGLGAGCVLMMVVGIVTLCQYKLHAEDKMGEYNGFRDSGTLPAYRTNAVENYAMTDNMAGGGSILGGDTIVENNPYYNHDDMDAKDDRYGFD